MGLGIREVDGIVVLTPHGMLLGGKETEELEEKVADLGKAGNEKLVFDLGKTTYMSSMGMAVLFGAFASYTKRGGQVKISCVDRKLKQIFVIVRLTLVYGEDLHDTLEEAVAGFRPAASPATVD